MPNREIYDRFSSISCSPTHINKLYQELAALQAEVKELKQQKINCLEIIDDDSKERSELKAEVERLKEQLKRSVEIADKIWADCSNGSEHTELAALKGEIK